VDDFEALTETLTSEPRMALGVGPEEDRKAKDSAVPKGTFASEEPVTPRQEIASDPPKAVAPEGRASPSDPSALPDAAQKAATKIATGARPAAAASAKRPPFLASEILRNDLMPEAPGETALKRTLWVVGALGLLLAALGPSSFSLVLLGLGTASMLALGLLRLSYTTRATAVAAVGAAGVTTVELLRIRAGASGHDVLLLAGTTLLSSALLFRAWYRASATARSLVSAGLVFCVLWLALNVSLSKLSLGWEWQSWLPALTLCTLCLLLVLSLLAFMDDETTGACDVWGFGLLLWFAAHVAAREALLGSGNGMLSGPHILGLSEPLFAAPLAVALAQLFSRALGHKPHGSLRGQDARSTTRQVLPR
jgi:hypothetical protein